MFFRASHVAGRARAERLDDGQGYSSGSRAAYRLQVARHGEPQRVPVLVGVVAGIHPSLEGELPHLDLFAVGSELAVKEWERV